MGVVCSVVDGWLASVVRCLPYHHALRHELANGVACSLVTVNVEARVGVIVLVGVDRTSAGATTVARDDARSVEESIVHCRR